MGIKSLIKTIKKYSPSSIQKINPMDLCGQTMAVDASIYIYESKYKMNFNKLSFEENFTNKLLFFSELNINLIFVFDGDRPSEKNETILKRKEQKLKILDRVNNMKDGQDKQRIKRQIVTVTREEFDISKTCLERYNVRYIISKNEGEATCARLVKEKQADIVLTNDSDTLAFGSSYIFKRSNLFYKIDLDNILDTMKITHDQFLCICLLLGCDYSKNVKKINIGNIYNIVLKYKNIDEFIKYSQFNIDNNLKISLLRSKELFGTLGDY